jgi:GNAT superfamily N-acetyltransferase
MLAQCSQSKASQFERGLKNSKNLASYCEHCCKANGEIPSIWKGAQRYPCPELASIKWKSNVVRPCYISKATSVEELDTLQQSHGDHSVGYLNWNALQEAIDAARVRTITVDSTLAGYVINTAKRRDGTITIQQVIVHRDYRGECYGKALIEHLAVENPGSAMHCHVRSDLPANLFWEAIGFVRLRTKTHKTSGRTLVEYHRPCFLHFNRKEIEK